MSKYKRLLIIAAIGLVSAITVLCISACVPGYAIPKCLQLPERSAPCGPIFTGYDCSAIYKPHFWEAIKRENVEIHLQNPRVLLRDIIRSLPIVGGIHREIYDYRGNLP
jgi:hypothetical protein